jgi:hypothetical protein
MLINNDRLSWWLAAGDLAWEAYHGFPGIPIFHWGFNVSTTMVVSFDCAACLLHLTVSLGFSGQGRRHQIPTADSVISKLRPASGLGQRRSCCCASFNTARQLTKHTSQNGCIGIIFGTLAFITGSGRNEVNPYKTSPMRAVMFTGDPLGMLNSRRLSDSRKGERPQFTTTRLSRCTNAKLEERERCSNGLLCRRRSPSPAECFRDDEG